jgi:hypothetical protein
MLWPTQMIISTMIICVGHDLLKSVRVGIASLLASLA